MTTGPKFFNSPTAPDVFVDSAIGFFSFNGNMRITFEAVRSDYSQDPANLDHVVVGRLVMPVSAAEAMARTILQQIESLANQPIPASTSVQ